MTVTTDKKSEPEDNMGGNDENGAAADGLDDEKTFDDRSRRSSEPRQTPMPLRASEGGGRVVSSSAPLR